MGGKKKQKTLPLSSLPKFVYFGNVCNKKVLGR